MKRGQPRKPPRVSPPPPEPPSVELSPVRERALFAVSSLLLLAPCFWQSRLQISDLESHIYNAWLAQLIGSGRAPGLVIVRQWTNVLFDWILGALFRALGAGPAQRLSVALAVLVFAWGAFAFVARVSGRRPWHLMPLIGILAYGWTLHMGFMNFYLSLGLCLWALALAWSMTGRGLLLAAPLLVVALLAHALPVAWALGVLAYVILWRRVAARLRWRLLGGVVAALTVGVVILRGAMPTLWARQQVANVLGIDQALVFTDTYGWIVFGLLFCCALPLFQVIRRSGFRTVFWSLPFQIWLLTLILILLVPNRILVPGYKNALSFIGARMSLVEGVCLCALLGAAPLQRFARYGIAALALVFFALVYLDERILNQFEDRVEAVVRQLPPHQRVINGIENPALRVNALTHMIDRICVGHCFSYANYEPSTGQFRIRVTAPNPIVVAAYDDSAYLQFGGYVVKGRDAPLYQVRLTETGEIVIRELPPGVATTMTFVDLP